MMIWKQLGLAFMVDLTSALFSFDALVKFTRGTISLLGRCLGRVLRHQRDASIKRLKRRKYRHLQDCTYRRGDDENCKCRRCTWARNSSSRGFRRNVYNTAQTTRVMDSDYLAHLAYNYRVSKPNETYISKTGNMAISTKCPSEKNEELLLRPEFECQRTDHRDLRTPQKQMHGWEWWHRMQKCADRMPPMQMDDRSLSQSPLSKVNDVRIDLPEKSVDALVEVIEVPAIPVEQESKTNDLKKSSPECKMGVHFVQTCGWSKSDSKIGKEIEKMDISKSASTKTMYMRKLASKREGRKFPPKKYKKKKLCRHSRAMSKYFRGKREPTKGRH